ncbi:MAG: methyltransferase domain-containing protein [Candidatus Peribacteria bacterium]|nr:MAG: methyltransferase domain-containing protein [Candidatus Peribacteria bacterium]
MFRHAKNILVTGAVAPMSDKTTKRIPDVVASYISDPTQSVVVEYGAGTGNITDALVEQDWNKVSCYEILPEFASLLQKKFAHKTHVQILQKSAERVLEEHAEESVDAVVTTIPLSFLEDKIDRIL